MSWLSGLADKAEGLLNNLDQSAASALNESNLNRSTDSPMAKNTGNQDLKSGGFQSIGLNAGMTSLQSNVQPNVQSDRAKDANNSKYLSQMSAPRVIRPGSKSNMPTSNKRKSEDKLFEFLNSNDTDVKSNVNVLNDRRHASNSSMNSNSRSTSPNPVKNSKSNSRRTSEEDNNGITFNADGKASSGNDPITDRTKDTRADNVDSNDTNNDGHTISGNNDRARRNNHNTAQTKKTIERQNGMELEIKLLKKEISSLNEELHGKSEKFKYNLDSLTKAENDIEQLKLKLKEADSNFNHLSISNHDMKMSIDAKDSQLAVLKIRLKEADDELRKKNETLDKIQQERDRVLQHHNNSTDAHSEALELLKVKLKESEEIYQREKSDHDALKSDTMERQHQLEMEKISLAEELTALRLKIDEGQKRIEELNGQLRTSKATIDSIRQENADYKVKATRILQSKDKVITKLQDGIDSDDKNAFINLGLEEMRKEKDMIREELSQRQTENDELRRELQEIEQNYQDELISLRDHISSLEDSLNEEKQRRDDSEQDAVKLQMQVQYLQNELMVQKTNLHQQKQKYEDEIERLKLRNVDSPKNQRKDTELEDRIKSLTENLIQKQTIIETLNTEKNSLVLQMERLEKQYRDIIKYNEGQNKITIEMPEAQNDVVDEGGVRMRSISSIIPGDDSFSATQSTISHRVKNAANALDSASARIGRYLRYYPVARLFSIFYVILLHLWVMFVLLTYSPEIHNAHNPPPKSN
ncbi:Golgin subfamily A member 5 [Trichoplax sp. H2]|nr:Golgin subfamily A member 5 [Trichoplax sp. H2]|eukprot:RDD42966.1 Golgin subfamily A member 5 [Trichoplax sp. H2]